MGTHPIFESDFDCLTEKDIKIRHLIPKRFTATMPKVIFVLGGPGAGKGTICEHLSNKYGFGHLSAGELLREEMKREGSEYGKLISEINQAGKIVPSHITVGLLQNEINKLSSSDSSESVFLIDGFPRNQENFDAWAKQIDEEKYKFEFCLYLNCSLQVCENRILKRAETGGRADDNLETLRKRFQSYLDIQFPIIAHYQKIHKCVELNTEGTREENKKAADELIAKLNLG